MKNFKIVIQYDGTKYNGWQKQGNTRNTIQNVFENILFKYFNKNIEIFASGRTDAGTHAKYQVANFKLNTNLNTIEMRNLLNKFLPNDISVIDCKEVDIKFHSRLNAKSKKYVYIIDNGKIKNVFLKNFSFRIEKELNLNSMIEASKLLIGEHDFRGFCSNKRYKKSTIRNIYNIEFINNNGIIEIVFEANGFLYNMVRIMVGTLIEIGLNEKDISCINKIFKNKIREDAGFTAPSKGLTLIDVKY